MEILLLTAVAAAIALAALSAFGRRQWHRQTQRLTTALEAGRTGPTPARFDARELDALPAVVQRYFRAVLPDGTPLIAAAALAHTGTFNVGERGERWKTFSSRQRIVTQRPGFVWEARIRMLPGISVHVHDAYIAGEGMVHPAVLGLFSLGAWRDTTDIARGELMRFLAEAPCYPTALLPSQGVRWEGVDARSAQASLSEGRLTVSLTFGFGSDGLVESVRAAARGRLAGGHIALRPWEGRWQHYQRRAGLLVPTTGEVAWLLPASEGGRTPYWRGKVSALAYEWAGLPAGEGSEGAGPTPLG